MSVTEEKVYCIEPKALDDILEWLEPPQPNGQLRAFRIKDEAWFRANSVPLADLLVNSPDNILLRRHRSDTSLLSD